MVFDLNLLGEFHNLVVLNLVVFNFYAEALFALFVLFCALLRSFVLFCAL